MPRKRMVDPSFWRDEKIGECTYSERLLFQGLWTFADDNGVGRANPKLIKADIFPYDTLRDSDVAKSLRKLAELGLIQIYQVDNQQYYHVTNFKKHQTINKPSPSTLPLPNECGSTTVAFTEDSVPKRSEDKLSEKEVKGKEDDSDSKRPFGEFGHVLMRPEEYDKLISKFPKTMVDGKIASLDSNIQSGQKKYMGYKDHYATIGNWCRRDTESAPTVKPAPSNQFLREDL